MKEIGAWILGFERQVSGVRRFTEVRDILQAVHEVVRHYMGEADPYDEVEPPLLLAIGLPGSGAEQRDDKEEWDDMCRECGGWEYIDGCTEANGKSNEYGGTLRSSKSY